MEEGEVTTSRTRKAMSNKDTSKKTPYQRPKKILPPCCICKQTATGIHYGVPTCEACKAFFYRNYKRRDSLACEKGNKCTPHEGGVMWCSACRMALCLQNGMSIEGIKMGRYSFEKKAKFRKEISGKDKGRQKQGIQDSPFKDLLMNTKNNDNGIIHKEKNPTQGESDFQERVINSQFGQGDHYIGETQNSTTDFNSVIETEFSSIEKSQINTIGHIEWGNNGAFNQYDLNEDACLLQMCGVAPKRSDFVDIAQREPTFSDGTGSNTMGGSSINSQSPNTVTSEESMEQFSDFSNNTDYSIVPVENGIPNAPESQADGINQGLNSSTFPSSAATVSNLEDLEGRHASRQSFGAMLTQETSACSKAKVKNGSPVIPQDSPIDVEFTTLPSATSSSIVISMPINKFSNKARNSRDQQNVSAGHPVISSDSNTSFGTCSDSRSLIQSSLLMADDNGYTNDNEHLTNGEFTKIIQNASCTLSRYKKEKSTDCNKFRSTIFRSPQIVSIELEQICLEIDRITLEHHQEHNISYDEINEMCVASYTKYMESKQWTEEFFGNLTPLPHEEHYQLYQSTGIDLDGRFGLLQWISETYEDELKCYVDFCKKLPEFRKIPISDQIRLVKNAASGFFLILDIWVVDLKNKIVTYPSKTLREARTFHWNDFKTLYSEEYLDMWYNMMLKLASFNLTENQIIVLACLYVHTREFSRTDEGYTVANRLQNVLIEALRQSISTTQKDPTLLPKIMRFLTYDMDNFRKLDNQESIDMFSKFGASNNICLPLTYDIYCQGDD